ncbi:MAG: CDP-diacylglycerol--glycerol-3-phosphate 3-phosphatidyltransferase [Candidatus Aminicenantes bacterium]|jgi:CDP-diacylglycerol--glycerol-3-phosphate 3-phosphatidyltransferase|nr:CDP-diacylglycerol--glycerol-3-phosphate 3-phosphatidyltransferase [Candidatus Aminicenantes bacterium]
MNIPMFLTITRIIAIPALVVVMISHFPGQEIVAFSIFVFACLTDMLDGFWARRKKMTTVLGSLLDPLADKLLIASALICLVESQVVASWMAIIIIGREIAVTGFRGIASSRGYNIPASGWGKLKMILETVTIAILILGPNHFPFLYRLAHPFGLWLIVIMAIFSAVEYFVRFGHKVLSEAPS